MLTKLRTLPTLHEGGNQELQGGAQNRWNVYSLPKNLFNHGFICVDPKIGSVEDS